MYYIAQGLLNHADHLQEQMEKLPRKKPCEYPAAYKQLWDEYERTKALYRAIRNTL